MSTDGTVKLLEQAFDDAALLVKYLSARNKSIDRDAVQQVVEAQRAVKANGFNEQIETAFWSALNNLSLAAYPATPKTIRLSLEEGDSQRGSYFRFVRSTTSRYRIITALFMFVAIILNSYVFVAERTLTSVREINTRATSLSVEMPELASKVAALDGLPNPTVSQAEELSLSKSKLGIKRAELVNLHTDAVSQFSIMTSLFLGFSTQSGGKQVDQSFSLVALQYITDILKTTTLPLIMGGLGACVFVVRRIGELVEVDAFDSDSGFSFRLRIYLGCIAGLIVAQFNIFAGQTLSPLAFAFLAGYGIEVFFAALDKLVGAFVSSNQSKP